MPSRPIVVLVAAFWLATAVWLVNREFLPWLHTDEPPPFLVDLADEAAPQYAMWDVMRDGKNIGTARTRMEPRKDGTFIVVTELRNLEMGLHAGPGLKLRTRVPRLDNVLRVNRAGELKRIRSTAEIEIGMGLFDFRVKASLTGEMRGDELHATIVAESPVGRHEQELQPVRLASRNVISPMMPLNRIGGLYPGRRWRMTAVDPLSDAIVASLQQTATKLGGDSKETAALFAQLPGRKPKELLAEVIKEKRRLAWEGEEHDCYVIEYRDDAVAARTWVSTRDGMVLRQEAGGTGEQLTLERIDVGAPR